ncbi:hypothetical protein E4T66_06470 [Sinimarinibacterium sp. CAU 1509]|uniref:lipoprotein n=1 Tax=Sinimarinibacterium sp. CAU 1509 TaxID=2562283 RepID=UPI0010AB514B|nr:lipoprotein [Sinimarinibacterium sp. CAU 1509]TJY61890.1 hypothetical protein E4T66_06470 [Sinimarinibacterium sp. CAU 1509]
MKKSILLVAAGALLLLSACSKATPANYEKVKSGMSPDEVHAILGKPDDVSGGGIGNFTVSTETWNGSKNVIEVTYAGDKVSIKRIAPREDK